MTSFATETPLVVARAISRWALSLTPPRLATHLVSGGEVVVQRIVARRGFHQPASFDPSRIDIPEKLAVASTTRFREELIRFRRRGDAATLAMMLRGGTTSDGCTLVGVSELDAARKRRRGIILLQPHVGPLAGPPLAVLEAGMELGVFSFLDDAQVAPYRRVLRLVNGEEVASRLRIVRPSASGAVSASRILRRGGCLVWQPDARVAFDARTELVEVPFLGRSVSVSPMALRLARRTGAALVFSYAELLDDDRIIVRFVGLPGVDDLPEERALGRIYEELERCLVRHAAQWSLWFYPHTAIGLSSRCPS